MKKIALLIVACLILSALAGCKRTVPVMAPAEESSVSQEQSAWEEPPQINTYRSEENSFCLSTSLDLTVSEKYGEVLFLEDNEKTLRIECRRHPVSKEAREYGITDFESFIIDQTQKTFYEVSLNDMSNFIDLDSNMLNATKLRVESTTAGLTGVTVSAFMETENSYYILVASGSKKSFDKYEETVNELIYSLEELL